MIERMSKILVAEDKISSMIRQMCVLKEESEKMKEKIVILKDEKEILKTHCSKSKMKIKGI